MTDQTKQRSLRLLVVEDECMIAFELSDLLEDLGHQVVGMAAAPDQALRLIRELDGQIDAAMVDANLGGQSSTPIIGALVAAKVPFAITSGYDARELEALGIAGMQIVKPYTRDQVSRKLQSLISTRG